MKHWRRDRESGIEALVHKIGCIAPHHRRWTWRALASAGHTERAGNRAPERIAPTGRRSPTHRTMHPCSEKVLRLPDPRLREDRLRED